MTLGDYITAFLKVVVPICYQVPLNFIQFNKSTIHSKFIYKQFNPDLVLVSAGFDAAIGDPLVKQIYNTSKMNPNNFEYVCSCKF